MPPMTPLRNRRQKTPVRKTPKQPKPQRLQKPRKQRKTQRRKTADAGRVTTTPWTFPMWKIRTMTAGHDEELLVPAVVSKEQAEQEIEIIACKRTKARCFALRFRKRWNLSAPDGDDDEITYRRERTDANARALRSTGSTDDQVITTLYSAADERTTATIWRLTTMRCSLRKTCGTGRPYLPM